MLPNEYVYLKCPEGMNLQPDECLEIRKGMYGLVQVARLFWKRFADYVTSTKVGMKQCEVDQCLFVKKGLKGIVILLLYVDDSTLFGNHDAINEIIE